MRSRGRPLLALLGLSCLFVLAAAPRGDGLGTNKKKYDDKKKADAKKKKANAKVDSSGGSCKAGSGSCAAEQSGPLLYDLGHADNQPGPFCWYGAIETLVKWHLKHLKDANSKKALQKGLNAMEEKYKPIIAKYENELKEWQAGEPVKKEVWQKFEKDGKMDWKKLFEGNPGKPGTNKGDRLEIAKELFKNDVMQISFAKSPPTITEIQDVLQRHGPFFLGVKKCWNFDVHEGYAEPISKVTTDLTHTAAGKETKYITAWTLKDTYKAWTGGPHAYVVVGADASATDGYNVYLRDGRGAVAGGRLYRAKHTQMFDPKNMITHTLGKKVIHAFTIKPANVK